MLYHLSASLEQIWGPLRLLGSHVFLMAAGTFAAALLSVFLLPRLWAHLPHDHGKAILGKDGMKSAGKPTGGGFFVTLLALPAFLLFTPLTVSECGALVCFYLAMACGYLDDRAEVPWGQLKKGLLDAAVSLGAAFCVFHAYATGTGDASHVKVWLPLVKGLWAVPWYVYVPAAGFMLWFTMNATNCSDGVDGLAGTLTLITLVSLAAFLYLVVGNQRVAHYLIAPELGGTATRVAARWAVLVMIAAGSFAGYLWWNAEPSKILMGDAGSRFLGLLVGAGVLATGNAFLVFAFAPVVLVNGGAGLGKLVLLRLLRKLGLDVRPPSMLPPELAEKQNVLVRLLHGVRFPLHDHCKRTLKWSNAQVLMRFVLLQAFIAPLVFVLLIKVR